MDKRKALGRGLESLLPSRPSSTATAATPAIASHGAQAGAQANGQASGQSADPGIAGAREIPLELIDSNPYQTRGQLDEAALAELAASIKEKGVLQPILVRPVRVSGSVTNGDNRGNNGVTNGDTSKSSSANPNS